MTIQNRARMHPLVAAAAVSVTLVSLFGLAAMTGVLPAVQGGSAVAMAPPSTISTARPMAEPSVSSAVATGKLPSAATNVATNTLPAAPALPATVVPAPIVTSATAPFDVADTLAPGETLLPIEKITSPAGNAVVATKETPVTSQPDDRAPVRAIVVVPAAPSVSKKDSREGKENRIASVKPAPPLRSTAPTSGSVANGTTSSSQRAVVRSPADAGKPAEAPRIVPVYRDQRSLPAGESAVYPGMPGDNRLPAAGDTAGRAGIDGQRQRVVPVYPDSASRDLSRREPFRRAAGSDAEATVMPDQLQQNALENGGTGARIGTMLGRTVGDGIDRTISVISEVLGGRVLASPGPAFQPATSP